MNTAGLGHHVVVFGDVERDSVLSTDAVTSPVALSSISGMVTVLLAEFVVVDLLLAEKLSRDC